MDDVVDRQVAAYNSRDVDAFVACYAEDVVIEDGRGNVLFQGRDGLREAYAPFFRDNPRLRGEIEQRIRIGPFVIDEETISGMEREPVRAVAVYRVTDGLIDRVLLLEDAEADTN